MFVKGLEGIIPVVITPFTAEGEVDESARHLLKPVSFICLITEKLNS
jgi:hypothetical protein